MKQSERYRSRILDVAEEIISEQGFDRVSVRDITSGTGESRRHQFITLGARGFDRGHFSNGNSFP